jgi:hypothetical protein
MFSFRRLSSLIGQHGDIWIHGMLLYGSESVNKMNGFVGINEPTGSVLIVTLRSIQIMNVKMKAQYII